MDIKEALQVIEENLAVDYGNLDHEQIARLDEAIDMAMDALRNLPNRLRQAMDTISRKGTIEAIQQHFNPTGEELPTELASVLAGVGVVIGTMPPAQPEKRTEEHTETHACDLISRQAAIDALFKLYEYQRDIDPTEAADLVRQGVYLAEKKIEQLPSAQPEKRTEERTETHACDCISRKAAIEAIENTEWYHLRGGVMVHGANSKEHQAWYKEQDIYKALEQLPSAQPEITICIECVHYEPLGKEKAWGRCSVHSSPTENQRFVQSCDFCAWAERKTDG